MELDTPSAVQSSEARPHFAESEGYFTGRITFSICDFKPTAAVLSFCRVNEIVGFSADPSPNRKVDRPWFHE